MKDIKHETLRSERMSFEKDFSDYLIGNHKDHWKASKCTFFQSEEHMKSWAVCSFVRWQ
jgi:hypothetical protein